MTLISQNAIVRHRVNKQGKRKDDEPSLVEGSYETPEYSDLNAVAMISKKKKRKKGRRGEDEKDSRIEEELEMKNLGNFLFGSVLSPLEFERNDSSALFILDRSGGGNVMSVYEESARNEEDDEYHEERNPVWVDEEEEKSMIDISRINRLRKLRRAEDETIISGSSCISRLRALHERLNPGTHWAKIDPNPKDYSSDDEDSAEFDDILRTNDELVMKSGAKLLPGTLDYSALADANAEDPSDKAINSVHFHNNHQLFLAAGLDSKLRFFQIDGNRNKLLDVVSFEDFPIHKAAFLPDGSQAIISGQRKYFCVVDITKADVHRTGPLTGRDEKSLQNFEISPDSQTIAFVGNEGYIFLVSARTKELMGTLNMNGTVRSLAFTQDGQQLLRSGGDGHMYFWDLRTRTCLHKGTDEGSLNGTALCASPVRNMFAAGSSRGIVNVYNHEEFLGGKMKPMKTLNHLTEEVDFLKFNHDAQILAMCSKKSNSLKLVHVPSFTAFSNCPRLNSPSCLDFSPAGGFMAVGNGQGGRVLLYKLHHYQQS